MDIAVIATRRRACASGAAPRSRRPTSKRSCRGSTGPSPKPRPPRQGGLTPLIRLSPSILHDGVDRCAVLGQRPCSSDHFRSAPKDSSMAQWPLAFSSPTISRPPPSPSSRIAASTTDVKIGLSKDELEKIIGDYDGLAIRSATKVTEKVHRRRHGNLKVIGRAGIGVDNVDIKAATAQRRHRHEHAVRQFHHHGRARHLADAGARPPDPRRRSLHPGRQVGEVAASWASSCTARRSASSAAATSAPSSPTARSA